MIDVDKTTFEEEVLKAEGYVFVDFYGDGCVPCQALMPMSGLEGFWLLWIKNVFLFSTAA